MGRTHEPGNDMSIAYASNEDLNTPHDPRLRAMQWRDLVGVTPLQVVLEPLLPAAWLAASLVTAAHGHYLVALGLSFMFFLTGLRLIHNAFHGALGLSRRGTEIVLWVMSMVILGSMHAVRFTHLTHHRLNLTKEDVEGRHAQMPGWRALLNGPYFTLLMHMTALAHGGRRLGATVAAQLVMNAICITLIFRFSHWGALRYHVLAMGVGHCLTAFFAVWTVHHHCDRSHYIARTLRNRIMNAVTFNMFLHIEHHLFPLVPTCHLNELSRRIDRVAPELKTKIVF
jgi:fatty acid desaturase